MSTINIILGALLRAEGRAAAEHLSDPNTHQIVPDRPYTRAAMAASALPLMGRYADDDGPLDRTPTPAAARPQNRRQRRAQAATR